MLLEPTNIEKKLQRTKQRSISENELLAAVQTILVKEDVKHDAIKSRISKTSERAANKFNFDRLESDRIYHIDHIKEICITYRLRFLDSKYFKGEIPQEALAKIKALERLHQIEIQGFKIVAPSRLFKLEDKDDPLLFTPMGNGYYYLIHRWGNDLHALRKILVWPFRNIINLILVVVLVSFFATLLIPDGLFSKTGNSAEFWIVFFFMFKSLAAIVIFYGFALGKNFNPAIWNSKYFNA